MSAKNAVQSGQLLFSSNGRTRRWAAAVVIDLNEHQRRSTFSPHALAPSSPSFGTMALTLRYASAKNKSLHALLIVGASCLCIYTAANNSKLPSPSSWAPASRQ